MKQGINNSVKSDSIVRNSIKPNDFESQEQYENENNELFQTSIDIDISKKAGDVSVDD